MNERKHRVLVYLLAEIQEVLPTGENQGTPKHAERQHFEFEGENLDDAKRKLSEYLSFSRHFL
jgi:hypothetical protein